MGKNLGYTVEEGIVYVKDVAGNGYTAFYEKADYVVVEGKTKAEAKKSLIAFHNEVLKKEITEDLTGLKR